ncbi:hypothetical protein [Xanthobacter cornucopiae]|uniref:hypothetical protein n=1 Tax=Xanthobacter cornucopiae TaxID=3119924 RepID=UPI00372D81A6
MSGDPLHGPVLDLPDSDQIRCRARLLIELACRDKLTIRDLLHRVGSARGHWMVGTAIEVADAQEAWFRAGAATAPTSRRPISPATSTTSRTK